MEKNVRHTINHKDKSITPSHLKENQTALFFILIVSTIVHLSHTYSVYMKSVKEFFMMIR